MKWGQIMQNGHGATHSLPVAKLVTQVDVMAVQRGV